MEKIIGGIKRECYPLTQAQKLHQYTLGLSPTDEIVNMGTGRYLQTEINIAALREAINRAIERCESVRVRLWKDPETGEVFQYVMPYENEHFEYYDFSEWREDKVRDVMDRWTSQPFDTYGGKLIRVALVSMPNGYNGYYMNAHHMVLDGVSIVTFNRDVMDIYCSLMHDMPYPKPMMSYIDAVKKDLEYEAGTKKSAKDAAYWMEQFKRPEPMFTDFTGPGRLQTQRQEAGDPNMRSGKLITRGAPGNTVTYDLDTESTQKLVDFCKEHNLPVSVLLLHGLRTVLSKFNYNEPDISIKNFVSRRDTLLAKRSGGVRMHCLGLRTIVEPTATVMESLNEINKMQREMFLHADFPPLPYYYLQREAYGYEPGAGYECMGFTYQPATLQSIAPYLRGIPYKSVWYSSGRQPQPLYITAMHRPSDGGLTFHFGYQTDVATAEEINFFYYFLGRVLFRSIENPDKTVQEIMDMA